MMADKRRTYTAEFKREAVRLVTEQGYTVVEAARNLGLNPHMLRFHSYLGYVSPNAYEVSAKVA